MFTVTQRVGWKYKKTIHEIFRVTQEVEIQGKKMVEIQKPNQVTCTVTQRVETQKRCVCVVDTKWLAVLFVVPWFMFEISWLLVVEP